MVRRLNAAAHYSGDGGLPRRASRLRRCWPLQFAALEDVVAAQIVQAFRGRAVLRHERPSGPAKTARLALNSPAVRQRRERLLALVNRLQSPERTALFDKIYQKFARAF